MSIKIYNPAIAVTLFKMIKRVNGVAQRYAGLRRQIDLTPYLGEGGAVRTSKSLSAPAGGFTISFPDQPDTTSGDTFYALIEPMDMVEIRMARNPGQYAGGKLPLIMRGFVSTVRRVESMGADGKPERFVVVSGQDFGKLWNINQIFWPMIAATNADLLAFWQVGAAVGMAPAIYTASEFVTKMVGVMNKKVAALAAFASQTVAPFSVSATVPEGVTLPPQQAAIGEGNYWQILTTFADKPWNEIFVQDLEAGPQVVYRPVPYKDINGNFIMPGAVDPGTTSIDISQVVSLDMGRSDERVANIFWVDPTNLGLGSGGGITSASLATAANLDFSHQNNDPNLFGEKVMECQTQLYGGQTAIASPPAGQASANDSLMAWWTERFSQLKLLNRDNSIWEDGSANVQGLETIKPGTYLNITRGAITTTQYIEEVDHTFIPFQAWTTSVRTVRGDGFLVRDKFAGNAFWAEGRPGVY